MVSRLAGYDIKLKDDDGIVISFGAVLLVLQPEFLFGNRPTVGGDEESHRDGRLLGFALMGICMMSNSLDCEFFCRTSATDHPVLLLRKIGPATDPTLILLVFALFGTLLGAMSVGFT